MAQQQQARSLKKGTANSESKGLKLTQQLHEDQFQQRAAKAQEQTFTRQIQDRYLPLAKLGLLLAITGAFAAASQLNLSPVYGAIPASIWHVRLIRTLFIAGAYGGLDFAEIKLWRPALLPVVALWIPVMQWLLYGYSGMMGATLGPVVTEGLTIGPLVVVTGAFAARRLKTPGAAWWKATLPLIVAYRVLVLSNVFAGRYMQSTVAESMLQGRIAYQVELALAYAVLAPSKLLLFGVPALLHVGFLNPHASTPWALNRLENSLVGENFKLLNRQESVTGYISVLETTQSGMNYRVMRCDHSLLGGEWVMPRGKSKVPEPIYAIFTMLQAVRLVEVENKVEDSDAQALVIGAGVGTSPGALIAHGINTTIVEIDPVVLDYATKYFGLPSNHSGIVADAVTYMADVAANPEQRYDYIIHDVFTGGAEPVDLFTAEFLATLHAGLKPNGVIAINYASDLLQPTTHLILRTILSTFPSCRIFRELEQPTAEQIIIDGQDFTNMVVFCHVRSSAPVTFRKPVEADYLGSPSIQEYLLPQFEIPMESVERGDANDVLTRNNTQRLDETQRKSAVGHWNVMRTVIPLRVWELW